ncbi:MAG: cation transporter [Azoarcus sp.]|jgi:hypothetical protein|nr:cation transporter [Azoarcus sp.]
MSADLSGRLRALTGLLTVAHHIPGRIRLKLNVGALPGGISLETKRFGSALDSISGIHGIHFNKLARSVTVEYDNRAIPDRAWPDLLANRPSPEAAALLNRLQEGYSHLQAPDN